MTLPYRRVLLLFLVSGGLGLGYQVLWSKLVLQMVGVSAWSYALVLAAFMGGLAMGSRLLGRVADRMPRPIVLFGWLELGVGLYAVASEPLARALGDASGALLGYEADGTRGLAALGVKAALAAALLVPPTFLMGGTYPALVRQATSDVHEAGRRASQLYAVNAAGAVAGSLLMAFVVLPALGIRGSLMLLAIGNTAVGVVALALGKRLERAGVGVEAAQVVAGQVEAAPRSRDEVTRELRSGPAPAEPGTGPAGTGAAGPGTGPAGTGAAGPRTGAVGTGAAEPQTGDVGTATGRWKVLVLLGIVGWLSFACEVAWTRTFALVLGSSTYSFAVILAAFISGIAIGSALLARVEHRIAEPLVAFGWAQACAGALILLPLPFTPWMPWLVGRVADGLAPTMAGYAAWEAFKLVACYAVMLPAALFIGCTLPLAIKGLARELHALGADTGRAYAWNTLGNVAGALTAGLVLLPLLGMELLLRACAVGFVASGAVAVALATRSRVARWRAGAAVAVALAFAVLVPRWDMGWFTLIAFRHAGMGTFERARATVAARQVVFVEDDPAANVMVMAEASPDPLRSGRSLFVNGKPDASTAGDMPTQMLLGHLPLLLHPDARDVLVVGLASGITSGSVLRHPVEHLDVVDLAACMPEASRWFDHESGRPLEDPRTTFIADDARAYVAHATRHYDVIISEPSNPWTAGTGSLFAREFHEVASRRLAPGGIFVQWCQAYELSDETLSAIVRTFRLTYPHVVAFEGASLDLMLIGSLEPIAIDVPRLAAAMERPAVREHLNVIGFTTPGQILYMQRWSEATCDHVASMTDLVNTDDNLLLEVQGPRDLFLRRSPRLPWLLDDRLVSSPALWWSRALAAGTVSSDPLDVARHMKTKEFGTQGQFSAAIAAWSRLTGRPPSEAPDGLASVVPNLVVRPEAELVAILHAAAAVRDVGVIEGVIAIDGAPILLQAAVSPESAERWLAHVDALIAALGDDASPRMHVFRIDLASAARRPERAVAAMTAASASPRPLTPFDLSLRACRVDAEACRVVIERFADEALELQRLRELPPR